MNKTAVLLLGLIGMPAFANTSFACVSSPGSSAMWAHLRGGTVSLSENVYLVEATTYLVGFSQSNCDAARVRATCISEGELQSLSLPEPPNGLGVQDALRLSRGNGFSILRVIEVINGDPREVIVTPYGVFSPILNPVNEMGRRRMHYAEAPASDGSEFEIDQESRRNWSVPANWSHLSYCAVGHTQTFENGSHYLYFADHAEFPFPAYRSSERVEPSGDVWLSYVRESYAELRRESEAE